MNSLSNYLDNVVLDNATIITEVFNPDNVAIVIDNPYDTDKEYNKYLVLTMDNEPLHSINQDHIVSLKYKPNIKPVSIITEPSTYKPIRCSNAYEITYETSIPWKYVQWSRCYSIPIIESNYDHISYQCYRDSEDKNICNVILPLCFIIVSIIILHITYLLEECY